MKSQVQLHMGAVQLLLETCRRKGIYLTGGIKRAIFWYAQMQCFMAFSNTGLQARPKLVIIVWI